MWNRNSYLCVCVCEFERKYMCECLCVFALFFPVPLSSEEIPTPAQCVITKCQWIADVKPKTKQKKF